MDFANRVAIVTGGTGALGRDVTPSRGILILPTTPRGGFRVGANIDIMSDFG